MEDGNLKLGSLRAWELINFPLTPAYPADRLVISRADKLVLINFLKKVEVKRKKIMINGRSKLEALNSILLLVKSLFGY